MRILLFISFLLLSASAIASHIVGGFIAVSHVKDLQHKVSVSLYHDLLNGNPAAIDDSIQVAVYTKNKNEIIDFFYLHKVNNNELQYSQTGCAPVNFRTGQVLYEKTVNFTDNKYKAAGGYYIVYERCCRNSVITNIGNPRETGMVFYTAMPPLNTTSLNSSPAFKQIAGDYLCNDRVYTTDFSATDADGDSLVYRLDDAWAGYTTEDNPAAFPQIAPYPIVNWSPGYSKNTAIPGPIPLSVDPVLGQLTVNSSLTGLYVFAVVCEEYRKGLKIGETRREFQFLSRPCLDKPMPQLIVKEKAKQNKILKNNDTLLLFSQSPNTLFLNGIATVPGTLLSISVDNKTFNNSWYSITGNTIRTVAGISDTLKISLNLSGCIPVVKTPYKLNLAIRDDACPYPNTDTLHLLVLVKDTLSTPYLKINPDSLTFHPELGKELEFTVSAFDEDAGDVLTFTYSTLGYNLQEEGMSLIKTGNNYSFKWTPRCGNLNKKNYEILFWVNDNSCPIHVSDTLKVKMEIKFTDTTKAPYWTIAPADTNYIITVNEKIEFKATAKDDDVKDIISTNYTTSGFNFSIEEHMLKQGDNDYLFSWIPECKDIADEPYQLKFVARDNGCPVKTSDTLKIKITVKPLVNDTSQFIPNIITPNGDGKNEYFYIDHIYKDICKETFGSVEIFNRWGTKVYSTNNLNFKWHPTDLPEGVYFYNIVFSKTSLKGYIQLIK